MKLKLRLLIIFLLPLFFSGCLPGLNLNLGTTTAGVYKSDDYGEEWQKANKITDQTSLAGVQINKIEIDPTDHRSVYLGTIGKGAWLSENSGESWRQIFNGSIVYDIALDPQNKGIVCLSDGTNVYRTLNLGKDWQQIYLETRKEIYITALQFDPTNNLIIYLGTSNGEIYKTFDGGESWQKIGETENIVRKILVNPKNTKIVYAGTDKNGIFRSADAGLSWTNLMGTYFDKSVYELRDKYRKIKYYYDMDLDPGAADGLIFASLFGIRRTSNGGKTWHDVEILTPANSVIIRKIAFNPKDNNHIYYATDSAFYRSFDGGLTWLSSSLPSSNSVGAISVDPQETNVVYMGIRKY